MNLIMCYKSVSWRSGRIHYTPFSPFGGEVFVIDDKQSSDKKRDTGNFISGQCAKIVRGKANCKAEEQAEENTHQQEGIAGYVAVNPQRPYPQQYYEGDQQVKKTFYGLCQHSGIFHLPEIRPEKSDIDSRRGNFQQAYIRLCIVVSKGITGPPAVFLACILAFAIVPALHTLG